VSQRADAADRTLTTGSIPGTGIPFPLVEYERRQRALGEAIALFGIDALVVTSHASLEYLTGYSVPGGYFAPVALIVAPGESLSLVIREYDRDGALSGSWVTDITGYRQEQDQPAALAAALRRRGFDRARLGFELGTWNLTPRDLSDVQELLGEIRIVDATHLVPGVAAVKSPVEIDVMRASAALTDLAIETFEWTVRPGVSERDVAAAIDERIKEAGGSTNPPYPVLFGERTALPHGAPSDARIERDGVAFIEVAGWSRGYAAASCRSLVVGVNRPAESLHALAEAALYTAIDAIRPGAIAGDVDAACRRVIENAGRADSFRHRTGYQDGVRWFYRGGFSVEPGSPTVLVPGMTMHLAINLFEQGRFGVGASHSILVTENGCEALTSSPTSIRRVE